MAHPHKKVVCKSCGETVSQCRCMATDKAIEYIQECEKCAAKRTHVETSTEAKMRIRQQIGMKILDQRAKGISEQQISESILEELVDVKYQLEQIKNNAGAAKRQIAIIV